MLRIHHVAVREDNRVKRGFGFRVQRGEGAAHMPVHRADILRQRPEHGGEGRTIDIRRRQAIADGPAKLCQAFAIDGSLNGVDLLAGDGPGLAAMRRQAADLPRVTFLGWRDDVATLIKGADIVTLASREEGLGSSLCAAQWAGKPVVATAAGGIVEAVADKATGLLSPPGDAERLAQNLIALSRDTAMRRDLGEAAARRARGLFSLATFHARHLEIYNRLAGA